MRPVPRSKAPRSKASRTKAACTKASRTKAARARRLPDTWVVAALTAAVLTLVAPDISYAATSQTRPAAAGCIGIAPAVFPAAGFITNNSRTEGGHFWWRRQKGGASVCVGTVVEAVQYNATATKTWKVIVYSAQHPHGQVVAHETFTLGRGSYTWKFRIRHAFTGLSAVCVTAGDSFGKPCIHFNPSTELTTSH